MKRHRLHGCQTRWRVFLTGITPTRPTGHAGTADALPGLIRAGIAHIWFEKIHPYDDGNGRVGRAIVDHALSQTLGYPALACFFDSGGAK